MLLLGAAALAAALTASCGGDVTQSTTSGGGNGGSDTTTTDTAGSAGMGGSAGATTGGSGGSGGDPGCMSNGDCTGQLVCDVTTGICVPCTPTSDICPEGLYCTPNNECEVGCTDAADCPAPTVCDTSSNTCVGCVVDTDCTVGSICISAQCQPGCSGIQPCQAGLTCCGSICADLQKDLDNCGLCNNSCGPAPHATPACSSGQCTAGTCIAPYEDCNGDPMDGCEQNTVADGPCVCTPGDKEACYTGAPGTLGVGTCKAGERTCIDGVTWGPCEGQVLPSYELCNQLDDDCDGQIEPQPCVQCTQADVTCIGDVAHGCAPDGLSFIDEVCDPLQGTTCNPATGHCDGTCGLAQLGQSYIGCDYWPTVTMNVNETIFHFAVTVSNTTAQTAMVTITKGAATVATNMVGPNSVAVINLPWEPTLKGPGGGGSIPFPSSVRVNQGAYRLRSNQPVTVYQFSPIEYTLSGQFSYTNDASILLPVNVWTKKYRVASRHHFEPYGLSGFYAVTAREDGTMVTLAPGANTVTIKSGITGLSANGAGSVTLNAGDVIQLATSGNGVHNNTNDLTGALVTTSKPVQVIGGHQCVFIPYNTGYCDHLEETMFPEQTLSTTYIVSAPLIPTGGTTPKVNMVRVVATQPNTTLTYDPPQAGAPTSIPTAGQWIEIQNTAADFQITADQPILVMQYMEGQDAGGASGDPAMTIAVGREQYRSSYLFHAPTNYEKSYMNVVAPTGTTITLDGTAIPANLFTPVGATGYSVARATLSNAGNGNHSISGGKAFGISVYGYGQYTSYWYPGGSNLTKLHD